MSEMTVHPVLPALPVLFSVRGWTEEVNPAYITFIDEMRATGVEVIDTYVSPVGLPDFGAWAQAVVDQIDRHHQWPAPLHLMGYCLGGKLGLVVVRELEARGAAPSYFGIIDTFDTTAARRLSIGIDSLYEVPWRKRLQLLASRMVPPDGERFGAIGRSVLRRSLRSVRELPARGWRSRKRRDPATFTELRLTFHWGVKRIVTPAHCYNTIEMIKKLDAGDPSLNMGKYLSGGFSITRIEGSHENCIAPPHSTDLIARINADRRAVVAGTGPFQ